MTGHFQITLAASVLLGLGTSTALASGPPRYRFEVGQELIYRGSSDFKFESGSFATKNDWNVWVVRKNIDGGYRLVVQSRSASLRDGKEAPEPRDLDQHRVAQRQVGDASRAVEVAVVLREGVHVRHR